MYILVVDILRKSSISKLNHRYLNIKHGKNCAIKILISIVHWNLNTNFRKGGGWIFLMTWIFTKCHIFEHFLTGSSSVSLSTSSLGDLAESDLAPADLGLEPPLPIFSDLAVLKTHRESLIMLCNRTKAHKPYTKSTRRKSMHFTRFQ